MAVLTLAPDSLVAMFTTNQVGFDQALNTATTQFEWLTDTGGSVDQTHIADGAGFTYDANGLPTGGTVHSLTVLDPTLAALGPEVMITGLSVNLADLVIDGTLAEKTDAFWSTALAGDDTIVGTQVGQFAGFGDAVFIDGTETLSAGDDLFQINLTSSTFSSGIVLAIGDVDQIFDGGHLTAGNDTITVSGSQADLPQIAGDVAIQSLATVLAGDDRITLSAPTNKSELYGDVMTFFDGSLTGGNDTIRATSGGKDKIFGETGNARRGTIDAGDDFISGGKGDDTISGDIGKLTGASLQAGNDTIKGGGGNDMIYGDVTEFRSGNLTGQGHDSIEAGNGQDSVWGNIGQDTIKGGAGHDLLNGGAQSDSLKGQDGNDSLLGEDGNDTLSGGDGRDTLIGGNGKDFLSGNDGRDTLEGGDGQDKLTGGADRDNLTGGNGADIFRYLDASESGPADRDRITDFQPGTDRIDLSRIDAGSAAGDQDFVFIGSSGFSGAEGELRVRQGATTTVVEADIDGDGIADLEIVLDGSLTLGVGDFIL